MRRRSFHTGEDGDGSFGRTFARTQSPARPGSNSVDTA